MKFETEILGLWRETVQRDVHRFSSPERRPTLGRDARGHHKEYSNLRLPLHQQQQHLVRKTLLRLQGAQFEFKNFQSDVMYVGIKSLFYFNG